MSAIFTVSLLCSKAICNLIGAIVALTPWRVGFEINCPPRIPCIDSYFVASKSPDLSGYHFVDPSSNQRTIDSDQKLDLRAWSEKVGIVLFDKSDRHRVKVSFPLPTPLNDLSLVTTPCWRNWQDQIVELCLSRGNEVIAEAKFWYAINTKSKKLRSLLKDFIKNPKEVEIALKSPTLTLRNNTDDLKGGGNLRPHVLLNTDYERITISLLNSLFCYWNSTIAS